MEFAGTLSELFEAANVRPSSDVAEALNGVVVRSLTADSRRATAGSCFVAVPGGREDGARFIADAVRRGAVCVVSQSEAVVPAGVGAVRVHDARSALARLAAAYYGFAPGQALADMPLVGVTGTNGKTTTCVLLRAILEAAGRPAAMLGTILYDLVGERRPAPWTTPPPVELFECLATAAGHGARCAVMEVSSHALAQGRCDAHRFAAAVFTNLSGDHLDYHKSFPAYANAKKKLFDSLDGGGVAVVNADDARSDEMVSGCRGRVVRYGLDAAADVTGRIEALSVTGSRFLLRVEGDELEVRLSPPGRHNVSNALAAAATAVSLGVDLGTVKRGLQSVAMVPGRLQPVHSEGAGFNVFVDYAHTDDALANVLSTLRPLTSGRLICVFGCGGDRDRTKRPRMAAAVGEWSDAAWVTSDNPRTEDPGAIIEEIRAGFGPGAGCSVRIEVDRRAAIEAAIGGAVSGDTVLIAGKGHEDYQIMGDEVCHFDDVEVATDALRARGAVTR